MSRPSLIDIAAKNAADAVVGLIDEASKYHPELRLIPARPIRGLNYYTRVCTALPTAGFRDANDGVDASKGTFENRLVDTFILNPRWECDKALADAAEDGRDLYIAEEGMLQVNAGMSALCKQFYYGVSNDAKGFPGLQASVTSGMTVDAGGTTASTGSSVYAVSFGMKNVQLVVGNDGQFDLSDVRVESILGANSKYLTGYVQELLTRVGLQVGNLNAVGRIKDLTADSGKTLTDDLLAELLSKFPVGYRPDAIFMSRRSRMQLQQSRTATTPTGAAVPTPSDYDGIPIVATESIVDTEALS